MQVVKKFVLWIVCFGLSVAIVGCDKFERSPKTNPLENRVSTRLVVDMPEGTVTSLALGYDHSCALYDDGSVACWGGNSKGQLGFPSSDEKVLSKARKLEKHSKYSAIAAGKYLTCGITQGVDRNVECWGNNSRGELGLKETEQKSDGVPVAIFKTPDQPLKGAQQIFMGEKAVYVITDEAVLGWGRAKYVEIGKDDKGNPIRKVETLEGIAARTPRPVNDLGKDWGPSWVAGETFALAVTTEDVCAIIDKKFLCLAHRTNQDTIDSISSDGRYTVYLSQEGEPGIYATILSASSPIAEKPELVVGLPEGLVSAFPGESHVCSIIQGHEVHCWGTNRKGQLGFLDSSVVDSGPIPLANLNAIFLASGANHSCVVSSDNKVTCWGDNTQGQCGASNGPKTARRSL